MSYITIGDDAKKAQLAQAKTGATCKAAGGTFDAARGLCMATTPAPSSPLAEEGFGLPGGNLTLGIAGLTAAAAGAYWYIKRRKKHAA